MSTVQGDPEAFMTLNLSRNLNQGANPAYQLRDGFQTQSCMKADFTWDQEEVFCMPFVLQSVVLGAKQNMLEGETVPTRPKCRHFVEVLHCIARYPCLGNQHYAPLAD